MATRVEATACSEFPLGEIDQCPARGRESSNLGGRGRGGVGDQRNVCHAGGLFEGQPRGYHRARVAGVDLQDPLLAA